MRTKKSIQNIFFALIAQFCTTLCAFVIRTALIKILGNQVVSLNGLFTEVIAMLSLAEMGVGSAIVYNLYKPLADKDYHKVSQLMNLFEKAYRIIAGASFLIGCLLIPWIHYLVNEIDYSDNYIRLVYFLFVVQTSVSYLFAYKISLLNADQKKYINSIVNTLVRVLSTGVLLLVLELTNDYIVFLGFNIFFTILSNFITSLIVDKNYTYLSKREILPKEERLKVFTNIKDIFIKTISSKITNSTDNILISTLVGTLQVGYYSNYAMFFNVVRQLEAQFGAGIAGSVGDLLTGTNHKHSIEVLKRLTFIFYLCASCGMVCLYSVLSPFITLWLGGEYILDGYIVAISCYVVFFEFAKLPLWRYLEVSGLFKQDRNISILGSVINLFVSIILGLRVGIAGIFIGTLFTFIIQLVLKIRLLYRDFFHESPRDYYFYWIKLSILMIIQMFVVNIVLQKLNISNLYLKVILFGLIGGMAAVISNILVFMSTPEFRYTIGLIRSGVQKLRIRKNQDGE